MPVYFCASCWAELGITDQCCPHCGANPEEYSARRYRDRLIAALRHPEPQTVRRVIYLLGERREAKAVSALKALYEKSRDPFVQSEIVSALIRIGNSEAMSLVMRAASHPSFLVREAALVALRQVPDHEALAAVDRRKKKLQVNATSGRIEKVEND